MDATVAAELDELARAAAVIVATRDDALRPHVARGWGSHLISGQDRLDLVIASSESPSVVDDLESNGAIAVTLAMPTTYKAMQLKGTVERLSEPTAEEHERAQAHLEAFIEQVVAVGMRRDAVWFFGTGLVAARVHIHEVFDQTPGRGAGRPR